MSLLIYILKIIFTFAGEEAINKLNNIFELGILDYRVKTRNFKLTERTHMVNGNNLDSS